MFKLLLLLAASVQALDVLSTSGFQSCGNDTEIKVERFNIKYDRSTMNVTFDVAGKSQASQEVIAELRVNAYGKSIYNREFDPCDENIRLLCPIPAGDFAASGVLPIPAEFASQIPAIAFQIPNLDGIAQLYLKSKNGNDVLACLESGVRNGKTAEQPAVAWVTAGIAGAALALSGVSVFGAAAAGAGSHAPGGSSGPAPNVGDVVFWFQSIATNGMLSINYPPVYRAFTKNFGWATGLISWDQLQIRIDSFREKTGGNLTANSVAELRNSTLVFDTRPTNEKRSLFARSPIDLNGAQVSTSINGTNLNTGDSASNSEFENKATKVVSGMQGYVEQLKIPSTNTFLTVLLIFCIVLAATAVIILLFKLILELYAMCGKLNKNLNSFRKRYWLFMGGTVVRIILILYGIWVIYCLYQFKVGDSWAARVLAGVTLALFTGILAFFAVRITMLARRARRLEGTSEQLFDDKRNLRKYGLFYDQYKTTFWWMFIPFILYMFIKGCFIALGDGHGLVQTSGQLGCEVLLLLLLVWDRPFNSRAGNVINIIIATVRVLSVGCLLIFVEELGVAATTKTVTGVVLIVIQSVLSAALAILIAVNAIIICCKDNYYKKRRHQNGKGVEGARDTLTPLDARNSLIDPASYFNRGPDGKGKYQSTPTHDNFQMEEYKNVPPPPASRYDPPQSYRSESPYGHQTHPSSDANLISSAAPMGQAPVPVPPPPPSSGAGFNSYDDYRGLPPAQYDQYPRHY